MTTKTLSKLTSLRLDGAISTGERTLRADFSNGLALGVVIDKRDDGKVVADALFKLARLISKTPKLKG